MAPDSFGHPFRAYFMAAPLQQPLANFSFLVFQNKLQVDLSACITCQHACEQAESVSSLLKRTAVWYRFGGSLVTPSTRTLFFPFHVSCSRHNPYCLLSPTYLCCCMWAMQRVRHCRPCFLRAWLSPSINAHFGNFGVWLLLMYQVCKVAGPTWILQLCRCTRSYCMTCKWLVAGRPHTWYHCSILACNKHILVLKRELINYELYIYHVFECFWICANSEDVKSNDCG